MSANPAVKTVASAVQPVALSEVPVGQSVVINAVRSGAERTDAGDIGLRLIELGFVEGEALRVVAHGFPGREPIAVRIGNTTFALRRFEADHVLVTPVQGAAA
jgi:ferrous iron transport protein A